MDNIRRLRAIRLQKKALFASAQGYEFANPCHEPETGRFCETLGRPFGWIEQGEVRPKGYPKSAEISKEISDVESAVEGDPELKEAIFNYTRTSPEDYTGLSHQELNKTIREGVGFTAQQKKTITYLDKLTERKIPSMMLWRGVEEGGSDVEIEKAYSVGSEVEMKGYSSTSRSSNKALGFYKTETGVMYEIEANQGAMLEGPSEYGAEREVLLPKNSKFEVIGVYKNEPFKNSFGFTKKVTVIRLRQK